MNICSNCQKETELEPICMVCAVQEWFISEVEDKRISSPNQKIRKSTDPIIKNLSIILRSRICYAFSMNGFVKDKKTIDLLGAKFETIKLHLERQFKKGMSWDNHSRYGWHIDHIIPISSAKNIEDVYGLCHYTNLQPLWALDNMSKSDNILNTQVKLPL